jgi:hypothetical protein
MPNSFAHIYAYAIHNDKKDDIEDISRLSVQTFVQENGWLSDTELKFFSDGSVFDGDVHVEGTVNRGVAYKTMQEWLDVKIKERGKPRPCPKRPKVKFKKKPKYDPWYLSEGEYEDDYGISYEDTF